ncbi:hypothetical protein BBJ29_001983 [Phytophthora kernoviae]|uniref:Calreticulin n=1 Tax=Phytophthora kernoviae TaxID=325452 RepID=A0A421G742_9STRA|nr:hypothetical protein BBJ29_001983 [Phytophthora kernoviae]
MANALVAMVAATMGARVIAANAIISGLWGLLWALFWGYGCATQARVANYLGAGKPDLARRITALGFLCTGVMVAVIAVVTSVMDQHIISLYTTDQDLLTTCKLVLPVFVVACSFEAIEVLGAGALTGMSQVHTVFWVSAIGTWFINLPVAYVGGITMGYGFPALWVGVLSMELFKVSSYSLALVHVRWADMADRVKETAEASIDVEQSTEQFIAAAGDAQPSTPPLAPSPLTHHRKIDKNAYTLPKPGHVKVKPISLKSNTREEERPKRMKVKTVVALLTALLAHMVQADEGAKAEEMTAKDTAQAERQQQIETLTKDALFIETFETPDLFDGTRWFKSSHEKYSTQDVAIDEVKLGAVHLAPNHGLVLEKPASHYGLGVKLDEPLVVDGSDGKKELVVQYEMKMQKGLDCGGAYVKLLRAQEESQDFSAFSDASPFVIMFGPDKCGNSDKVHLIFQHKNLVTQEYEEKHMMEAPRIKSDKDTHLYTAVIRDDNTFEVFVDQKSVKSGSFFDGFLPSVIPEKEIDDPEDSKPADWVNEKKIRDPSAVKPDDWDEDAPARILDEDAVKPDGWLDDELEVINDPDVVKPEDWDDEDDGDFVVPLIPNPKCVDAVGCGEWKRPTKANPVYKGKFYAPYIPNPAYKGEWVPRKIPNPSYFKDDHPARMDPIGALAVEVWTMTDGITFDNFWLGNDLKKAQEFAELMWAPKHAVEEDLKAKAEKSDKDDGEGGVMKALETLSTDFAAYANENPMIALGCIVGVSVLATFALFSLFCGSKGPKPDDGKEDSGAEDEEGEEDAKAVGNDNKEGKVRQRKKAPIVKDD